MKYFIPIYQKSIYKLRIFLLKLLSLEGKVALVTGGSRGIGYATAKVLAENGASVVITGKDQDRLEKASSEISNSFAVVADVRKTDDVKMQ